MAKTDITKRALAESLKALMRKTPFSKISVESICEGAGISRRNFYRHFLDKYELLSWIYYEDFVKDVHNKHYTRSLDLFPDVCRELYNDRTFYINAFDVSGQNSFRSFCAEQLYPYLKKDFADACSSERSMKFYGERISSAVFDRLQQWLKSEPCTPPDQFAKELSESIRNFVRRVDEIVAPVTYSDKGLGHSFDPYIITFTGRYFHIQDPRKEEVDIRDIAHALSLICRGNGHFRYFYSVGQHCIACYHEAAARNYSKKVQAGCLLHDAAEAYLSDLTRAAKAIMPDYMIAEDDLNELIWSKYFSEPLTFEEHQLVSKVNDDMLAYEFENLMPEQLKGNFGKISSDPISEEAEASVNPKSVESEFIEIFDLLVGMKS